MASTTCLTLPSGKKMPQLGIGTWLAPDGKVQSAMEEAVKHGFRHIDCAYFYGNEQAVGEGIQNVLKKGLAKREELFIVSKLWNSFHDPKDVKPALMESLKCLQLDYLDLYLMHSPMGIKNVKGDLLPQKDGQVIFSDVDYLDTWKAMEKLVEEGLVKSIGVANFNPQQLDRLCAHAKICPDVAQAERHPYLTQCELMEYLKKKGIAWVCISPLSSPESPFWKESPHPKNAMEDPVVKAVAKKHGRSPAQILIRFNLQYGLAAVPKSHNPQHIAENAKVFDFCLDEEDLKKLCALNCGARAVPWDLLGMGKHKYYPFCKKE